MNAFVTALVLILPIAALASRRLPARTVIKLALVWTAIFGGLLGIVWLWQHADNITI
ncbi:MULTISPECIES: hypothetical protein [unclassified Sphingomonas]|uniref:hypothetical protein n=1 Tax=unclassified Sphingomonas TaxID=196159 RepID=UPI001F55C495|nr:MULTISPECIES: hypothetical protein [unclassified Sphingomonas]